MCYAVPDLKKRKPNRHHLRTKLKTITANTHTCFTVSKRKVRRSKTNNPITGLDRPLGLQEVEDPIIYRQSEHGDKVVSTRHRPPLPPGDTPGTPFC